MEIPELRKEFSTQYISDLLETVLNKKSISLWQNLSMQRDCIRAKLVKFNCVERKLKFYPNDLKHHFNFKSGKSIFFYESSKYMIFKTSICYQSSFELELRMPDMLMIENFRSCPRNIAYGNENAVFDLKAERGKETFSKQIVDYSEEGLSLMISARENPLFYDGDIVAFKPESTDINLPSSEGKIIYTTITYHPRHPTKKYVRVGIKFI